MDITRKQFDEACEAAWTEIEYRNRLDRRTEDEAKDVPGFLTLLRVYMQKTEAIWADNPGTKQADGSIQVEAALHGLRKLSAIAICSMIYAGVRSRE